MRYAFRALLAGGLGFAAAALVACGGGSGLLSAGESSTLGSQLDAVAAAIGRGHCTAAAAAAQGFDNSVANLTNVNSTLTDNLKQASSALAQQAGPDCSSRQSATTRTRPARTTATPTTSTQTVTAPTTSTPTNTATGSTSATGPATTPTSTGTSPTTPTTGGAGVGGTGTPTGGTGGITPGNGH